MKKYGIEELANMNSTELGNINQEYDEIMEKLHTSYTEPRIEIYSNKVDTAEDETSCHFNFVNLVYWKRYDVEDALNNFLKTATSQQILSMLNNL